MKYNHNEAHNGIRLTGKKFSVRLRNVLANMNVALFTIQTAQTHIQRPC